MLFAKYLSAHVEMKPGYIQFMRNFLLLYPRLIGREVENCDNTSTEAWLPYMALLKWNIAVESSGGLSTQKGEVLI
jgi:hypothetical protein